MALDIQTITATPVYVPYERPPQNLTLWSAIPRGLFSFVVATGQIDAKAANDTFLLQIQGTLPPSFGYVMEDLNFTISQDRATDWDVRCNLNLQNFFRAPQVVSVALAGNWTIGFGSQAIDNTQRGMQQSRDTTQFPTMPLVGTEGTSGILINFTAWNPNSTNAAAIGVVQFWISFWQFDLEQVRKYPINSPLPVQAR